MVKRERNNFATYDILKEGYIEISFINNKKKLQILYTQVGLKSINLVVNDKIIYTGYPYFK